MLKIFTSGNVFVYFSTAALVVVLGITIERFYTLYIRFRLRIAPFKGGIPGGPVWGGGPPGQSPNHCPGNRGCDL